MEPISISSCHKCNPEKWKAVKKSTTEYKCGSRGHKRTHGSRIIDQILELIK